MRAHLCDPLINNLLVQLHDATSKVISLGSAVASTSISHTLVSTAQQHKESIMDTAVVSVTLPEWPAASLSHG